MIKNYALPGSIIHTDLWAGYNNLENEGYTHQIVNHSRFFSDSETGVNTNTIEGVWKKVKMHISSRYRNSQIDMHLNEFIWRKTNKNRLWESLLYVLSLPVNEWYSLI